MRIKNISKWGLFLFSSLCFLLTMSQSTYASPIGLMDLLPQTSNGDRGLFVETEPQATLTNTGILNKQYYSVNQEKKIITFTNYFDTTQENPVLRIPLNTSGGSIRIQGEAGVPPVLSTTIPNNGSTGATVTIPSNEAFFSIELGTADNRKLVWSAANGGTFNFTVPYKNGDTIYFIAQHKEASLLSGAYWKNVQWETTSSQSTLWTATATIQADQDPSLGKWIDTGLEVEKDNILSMQAEGRARQGVAKKSSKKTVVTKYSTEADGKRYLVKNRKQTLQKTLFNELSIVPSAPIGALVATIQLPDGTYAQPFMVGTKKTFIVPETGKLLLAYNDIAKEYSYNDGSYAVNIQSFNKDADIEVDQPKDLLKSLEVDENYFRLLPGKSAKLKIYALYADGHKEEITKDKLVTYTSNNSDTLQGKTGSIKAGKTTGDATITISYLEKSITVSATVSDNFPKTVKADTTRYTLTLGDDDEVALPGVSATYPDKSYTNISRSMVWKSDKPDIAIVDGRMISAIGKGTATITGNYYDMYTVKIKVTVKEAKK